MDDSLSPALISFPLPLSFPPSHPSQSSMQLFPHQTFTSHDISHFQPRSMQEEENIEEEAESQLTYLSQMDAMFEKQLSSSSLSTQPQESRSMHHNMPTVTVHMPVKSNIGTNIHDQEEEEPKKKKIRITNQDQHQSQHQVHQHQVHHKSHKKKIHEGNMVYVSETEVRQLLKKIKQPFIQEHVEELGMSQR